MLSNSKVTQLTVNRAQAIFLTPFCLFVFRKCPQSTPKKRKRSGGQESGVEIKKPMMLRSQTNKQVENLSDKTGRRSDTRRGSNRHNLRPRMEINKSHTK